MSDSIIRIENISVFQQEKKVLSDITLNVKKGEFVYLIGKVGTGKTSFMKSLYAEVPIADGEGYVSGFNLKNISQKEIPFLRRKIGIVFQDFQLLTDRTVFNNLLFVLKATGWTDQLLINERINQVLDKVKLSDKIDKMPHQLSGGEQQRIVIARAMLNEPELILADEPTGNLDPETTDEIMNLLIDICKSGSAVFMATHNYGLIKKYPGRVIKCSGSQFSEITESIEAIEMEM